MYEKNNVLASVCEAFPCPIPTVPKWISYLLHFVRRVFVLMITKTYWVISGGTVVGCGAEDNRRQEESQQKNQKPEGKLPLDHILCI